MKNRMNKLAGKMNSIMLPWRTAEVRAMWILL